MHRSQKSPSQVAWQLDKALDLFQIISAVLEPKILFSIAMSVAEATAVNPNGTNKTLS